ncbi:MAG: D-alanine--D-alanine ligase [Candidatus Omnitrophota bacterium]
METNLGNFGRVGVLMGGPSSERRISLQSGKAVYESLMGQGLDVVAIDVETDNWQQNYKLIEDAQINVAFIALHGSFGEDGQIQALLEELKIPYTGSDPVASRLAMDKVASKEIFQKKALPVPNYFVISSRGDSQAYPRIIADLTPPFVVKPAKQGSSIGLSIVKKKEELEQAIAHAFDFDEQVIVEQYIPGREITVGILGGLTLPIVEIIPQNKFYDYEAKYTPGRSEYIVPADLPIEVAAEVQGVAHKAHQSLGCFGLSRTDIRLNPDNKPFVLEVNSIPGLTLTSLLPKAAKASGFIFSQLCIHLLRLAYERS